MFDRVQKIHSKQDVSNLLEKIKKYNYDEYFKANKSGLAFVRFAYCRFIVVT